MSLFLVLKTLHISTVALSICFFLIRVYWLVKQPNILTKKSIKILPHLIDSTLIISAFSMLYIADISISKDNPWVIAKLIAVSIYIAIGLYIFRIANKHIRIYYALCIAVLVYLYIIQTAITKNIIPILN